jgi:hypothetical protein
MCLELKTDNTEEMKQKILASAVKKLDVQRFISRPGGQVFRLVGIDEDLSLYEESPSSKPWIVRVGIKCVNDPQNAPKAVMPVLRSRCTEFETEDNFGGSNARLTGGYDRDKTRELLAPNVHALVTSTQRDVGGNEFTGIDNYMERKIKAAQLVEPGSCSGDLNNWR